MSRDLKRQFISQLVESSRLLRNYIDHRAKGRGTTRAQWIVLFRLREQEGLSQVDLLGWSCGGVVAQDIALQRPDPFRKPLVSGRGSDPATGTPSLADRLGNSSPKQ